ncbi:MAG TPA: TIGR01244 family sulfur transferase [Caulobacteraceae bacterium]|jgi:uncharacterized protein (TIGR01244 family)|nr:TIGR01244 family sulfur transferase [Caulobacteraceae bacterium]
MADIRQVSEDFAVAPQIAPEDMAQIAARGFKLVINNRPDGEAPGQPTSAEMAAAAAAAGLAYIHIPVVGGPQRPQVEAMHEAAAAADGPVFAFCRSGTRSIVTWSLGQALAGERSRADLIRMGHDAGYDLSGVLG